MSLRRSQTKYDYIVVGDGPAGILVVGELCDRKKKVLWCGERFAGGRLGKYGEVESNTKIKYFVKYFESCSSFEWKRKNSPFSDVDDEKTCPLGYVVADLQKITECLMRNKHVTTLRGKITPSIIDKTLHQKLILCTGAVPIVLSGIGEEVIDLDVALNMNRLRVNMEILEVNYAVRPRIVVYGNSHSGIWVLRNFMKLGYRNLVCVARRKLVYAVEHDDWIENDNTGLKGKAAQWARKHQNDVRWVGKDFQPENDDVVVFAVGFHPNCLPGYGRYCPITANIQKDVQGFGTAYPERVTHPNGKSESNVGMYKFVRYVKETLE